MHAPSGGRLANSGSNQSTNLPLPILQNYLPNAYISPNAITTYKKSVLAFLHNPKSGGTSIKRCIATLQKLKNESSPVVMATNTASKITEDLLNNVSKPSHYFMGESVIGVCDRVGGKPCAYFTMIREPYERTISHYYFCRGGGPSWPPCNNTLEEFTLSLCSVLFRQLTLRVLCNQSRQGHVLSWQCDNRPMTIDYFPFDRAQRRPALEFILQNLENIFAVVGILEEFETSLKLFEYTFGEPFYQKCRSEHSNSGNYVINGAKSHQRRSSTREMIRDEEKRKLMQNPDIRRCLDEDVQIYKKIKEIFKQQEIIYNKVIDDCTKKSHAINTCVRLNW